MKRAFCLSFFIVFTHNLFSQALPLPKAMPSPTAANLGKYGDVPVSFNTGAANVSVPLYSMNVKDVPLDITLSYNTGGVMVADLPSWVGQNWSLEAGGVITRQVKGIPDEWSNVVGGGIQKGFFYPESRNRLNGANWSSASNLKNLYLGNHGIADGYTPAGVWKESQPDMFTFNFMGITGKFFMGHDGEWKVVSAANIKVEILESDFIYPFNEQYGPTGTGYEMGKSISKIKLIDDKGNTYIFGCEFPDNNVAVKAIEYSKDFFSQTTGQWKATTWYLVKVVNAEDLVLYNLTYERDASFQGNFYRYETYEKFKEQRDVNGVIIPTQLNCKYESKSWDGGTAQNTAAIGGDIISAVYLKTIQTLYNETVTFDSVDSNGGFYDPTPMSDLPLYFDNQISRIAATEGSYSATHQWYYMMPYSNGSEITSKFKYRKLNSISCSTGTYNFHFNTDEFAQAGIRLQLKYIYLSVGNSVKRYDFEYDRFDQLPPYLGKCVDHLGYNRGANYTVPIVYANHYSSRSPNTDKVKIGSLTKITYPTKGYVLLEYEVHNYSRYVNDTKSAIITTTNTNIGGLRIKKITTNDDNGTTTFKTYKYVRDYALNPNTTVSSGIVNAKPKYWWPAFRVRSTIDNGTMDYDSFSTNPIIPLGNFFGSPISYDEVVEINQDGSYSIYKYTGHDDYMDELIETSYNVNPSPFDPCNDRSLLRGKLKSKETYNAAGVKVAKTTNVYSTNGSEVKYGRTSNIDGRNCIESPSFGFGVGNASRIYYFDHDLVTTTDYVYRNGQEFKTEKKFSYVFYPDLPTTKGDRFLLSESFQNYLDDGQSGEIKTVNEYSYPFSFSSPVNTDLIAKRKIVPLIQVSKRNGVVISSTKLEYDYFTPAGTTFLLPKRLYKSKGLNLFQLEAIIDDVDSYGNINQYHTPGGLYTLLSWSYNKAYPIMIIAGTEIIGRSFIDTKANEIQTLLGSTLSGWSSNQAAIIAKEQLVRDYYPSHQVTSFTYCPFMGLASEAGPDGLVTYYTYDSLGRLVTVKNHWSQYLMQISYQFKP